MARSPITYYRLWCGRKRYTPWVADRDHVFRVALRHGLGSEDDRGLFFMGPLARIEIGERAYPKARTIPVSRRS